MSKELEDVALGIAMHELALDVEHQMLAVVERNEERLEVIASPASPTWGSLDVVLAASIDYSGSYPCSILKALATRKGEVVGQFAWSFRRPSWRLLGCDFFLVGAGADELETLARWLQQEGEFYLNLPNETEVDKAFEKAFDKEDN